MYAYAVCIKPTFHRNYSIPSGFKVWTFIVFYMHKTNILRNSCQGLLLIIERKFRKYVYISIHKKTYIQFIYFYFMHVYIHKKLM